MGSANSPRPDLTTMPRGGADASCLDRILQTGRAEYLDREDVGEEVKRGVIEAPDRVGSLRAYSPSAFRELARHAGVGVDVRGVGLFAPQVVVARRNT